MELTEAAGVSAADLVEQALAGGYSPGRRTVIDTAEDLIMERCNARPDVSLGIIPDPDRD